MNDIKITDGCIIGNSKIDIDNINGLVDGLSEIHSMINKLSQQNELLKLQNVQLKEWLNDGKYSR